MKDSQGNKKKTPASQRNSETTAPQPNVVFYLPPGIKFSDMYMDASEVAQELNFSKRTVRNMRVSEKLSHTTLYGKIFYFRQEIASILATNKVSNSRLRLP